MQELVYQMLLDKKKKGGGEKRCYSERLNALFIGYFLATKAFSGKISFPGILILSSWFCAEKHDTPIIKNTWQFPSSFFCSLALTEFVQRLSLYRQKGVIPIYISSDHYLWRFTTIICRYIIICFHVCLNQIEWMDCWIIDVLSNTFYCD